MLVNSVKTRIIAAGSIVVFAACAIITFLAVNNVAEFAQNSSDTTLRTLAYQYKARIEKELGAAVLTAKTLAATVEGLQQSGLHTPDSIAAIALNILALNPQYIGTTTAWEPNKFNGDDRALINNKYTDKTGRYVPYFHKSASGSGLTFEPLDMRPESGGIVEWYYRPINENRTVITPPFLYPVNGKDVLMTTVSVPIHDKDNSAIAIATVDLTLDSIRESVSKIKPYEDGFAYLISHDGQWIAAPDLSLSGKAVSDPLTKEIYNVVKSGKTYDKETRIHGVDMLTVAIPVNFGTKEDWILAIHAPKATVFASAHGLQTLLLICSVFAVVVAVAVYYLVGFGIAKPIVAMSKTMKTLADGRTDVVIDHQEKSDEIGTMARALNYFREGLLENVKLRKSEEEAKRVLAYQAHHDSLTGAHNRFALMALTKSWIGPEAPPFAMLFIDLDDFKSINDAFGHDCGDMILVEAASRVSRTVPEHSLVARYGGDEFIVLIPLDHIVSVDVICATILDTLTQKYQASGVTLHIGASIGIALFPQDAIVFDQLLISANLAMRTAKQRKNTYTFFNPVFHQAMQKRVSIEQQLRHALDRNEIYLVFQPQITEHGRIHGVEVLARWESPVLGFVPPDQFIKVAEETGLISSLGEYIIRRSCAEFRQILNVCDEATVGLTLSINISVHQLLKEGFKEQLLRVVEESHLSKEQVVIEITESVFIEEPDIVLPLLHDIRKIGFAVSLDDFGTGYSSLSTLRTMPIDELKVDKSFVENICKDEQDSKMIRSIIEMGHAMGMRVVAEGVEENSQRMLLSEYGCDLYQGYYFSRPLKPDDFIAFVKEMRV